MTDSRDYCWEAADFRIPWLENETVQPESWGDLARSSLRKNRIERPLGRWIRRILWLGNFRA
jgi:hypothetical protein